MKKKLHVSLSETDMRSSFSNTSHKNKGILVTSAFENIASKQLQKFSPNNRQQKKLNHKIHFLNKIFEQKDKKYRIPIIPLNNNVAINMWYNKKNNPLKNQITNSYDYFTKKNKGFNESKKYFNQCNQKVNNIVKQNKKNNQKQNNFKSQIKYFSNLFQSRHYSQKNQKQQNCYLVPNQKKSQYFRPHSTYNYNNNELNFKQLKNNLIKIEPAQQINYKKYEDELQKNNFLYTNYKSQNSNKKNNLNSLLINYQSMKSSNQKNNNIYNSYINSQYQYNKKDKINDKNQHSSKQNLNNFCSQFSLTDAEKFIYKNRNKYKDKIMLNDILQSKVEINQIPKKINYQNLFNKAKQNFKQSQIIKPIQKQIELSKETFRSNPLLDYQNSFYIVDKKQKSKVKYKQYIIPNFSNIPSQKYYQYLFKDKKQVGIQTCKDLKNKRLQNINFDIFKYKPESKYKEFTYNYKSNDDQIEIDEKFCFLLSAQQLKKILSRNHIQKQNENRIKKQNFIQLKI